MVLLRRDRQGQSVLLGRRARSARFLPGVYAFPGGALEPRDLKDTGFPGLPQLVPEKLDQRSQRLAIGFARAAIRETFEETGLLLGRPDCAPGPAPADWEPWSQFQAAGLAPAFDAMKLIARAITPSRSPRRFHNRFFSADGALAQGRLRGNGELEDLAWVPIEEALALPMAEIGTLVLREALAHAAGGTARPAARFSWRGAAMRPAFPA